MLYHTKLTLELGAKTIWFYHSSESSVPEFGCSRMFEGFENLLLKIFQGLAFPMSCFVTQCCSFTKDDL